MSGASMIERVARAICYSATESHPDEEARLAFVERNWRNHIKNARAALAAMLEPTEGMLEASWAKTVAVTPEERMMTALRDAHGAHIAKMRRRFRAMIRAAIAGRG
jgi:hypothetical protein